HLTTFDEDTLNDFINKYASPPLRVELVRVRHESTEYLAVRCPEFRDTPVVCRRDGPEASGLKCGAVYVRPFGKPRTTAVQDASQMEELLELAAEKRMTRFLRTAERIGMEPSKPASDRFDEELGDLS